MHKPKFRKIEFISMLYVEEQFRNTPSQNPALVLGLRYMRKLAGESTRMLEGFDRRATANETYYKRRRGELPPAAAPSGIRPNTGHHTPRRSERVDRSLLALLGQMRAWGTSWVDHPRVMPLVAFLERLEAYYAGKDAAVADIPAPPPQLDPPPPGTTRGRDLKVG
jgi:hypothetical protein